jgi:phospholipid/cholesterol/gamma-HCH transport system ATP-binding protein
MSVHMMALIARLNREMNLTSVIVTHDLELMRQVADDVVILHEGRAIYFGPVGEIERNEHPHIQEFLALDRMAAEVE